MFWGLTARTRTSLSRTTARLSAEAGQPAWAEKVCRAEGTGSLARQASGRTSPAWTQARARAVAMRPAPRKPT